MPDLNYELAPKPGMTASQRKAELDGARFVAVRNLAYMIYKKPDGSALMTYQETLDNREMVKTAILNYEISLGYLQNDLGAVAVPQSQSPQQMPPQMVPQNGAVMAQQPPMQFQQPQMQAPQAPMSPAQFAQMPMAPQPMAPQYAAPPQMVPQMQQQQFAPQPQMMQAAAPPMEAAPVTGKKRKSAAGNAVAPPPASMVAPPGYQPQQAAVPVMQFQQPPAAPQQPFQPQMAFQAPPQAAPQQMMQQMPQQAPQGGSTSDLGPVLQKLDMLGKGIEVSAKNGDDALKAVAKLQADVDSLKLTSLQLLTCLHHMYLSIQGANGQQLLSAATEGKAGDLDGFRTYLQKFIGNPK